MNATAERTSWLELLEWRLEALRRGKSFAQIAQERSLVYRVEQLFLVHRATNRWLLHVAAEPAIAEDSAELASLLLEIEDFARGLFFIGETPEIEEFFVGSKRVWLAPTEQAYLAAIITGEPPRELKTDMRSAIERIAAEKAAALESFTGDSSPFSNAAPVLTSLLRAEFRPHAPLPAFPVPRIRLPRFRARIRLPRVAVPRWLLAVALALVLVVGVLAVQSERHWRAFVAQLKSEPGILVGQVERHWIRPSYVAGLRDPAARNPAEIAKEAHVSPGRVRFQWQDYTAADAAIIRRRFLARFGAVPEAKVAVEGAIVRISGRVPQEWLDRVEAEATQVEGVKSVVTKNATVAYDTSRALEQFRERFQPPATVKSSIRNNTLVLAGRASYEWLAPVRDGARKISGIDAINGDDLVVEFDPRLTLERFRKQFGIPQGVNASVQGGRLIVTGEAPHAWLDQVRRGAMRVAGVRLLDDRNIVDLDQRDFQQSKSRIDEASVLFVLNRDSIGEDNAAAVERIAGEVRRCLAAARNLGVNVIVEVRGYGDAVATEEANAELSRRRADSVRDAMIAAGVEEGKLNSSGLGMPPPPGPWEKSGAGQFDRRVFFKVLIQP